MYSNQPSIGASPITVQGKSRGAYKRKHSCVAVKECCCWGLARAFEEYTSQERASISDPYADGFEFAQAGGELWKLKTDLSIHGKGCEEARRLFRLGFKDGLEYMKGMPA